MVYANIIDPNKPSPETGARRSEGPGAPFRSEEDGRTPATTAVPAVKPAAMEPITPEKLLGRLQRRVGKSIAYFGVGRGQGGRWIPRWRIIVPKDIA